MAMLAEELWTHTDTSGEPVNHCLGGVRKCRGLFEVKLSWHGVHTSRHNRVSLSRPIIPTSNKWRATSWRVLVALILFILPFMRTFLLHLMVVLSSVVLSLRIQTHSHIPHLDGDQIEILGIGLGGKHLIYSSTPCMWNFLNAKNVNFSLSNQIAHIKIRIDNVVFYCTQSPYIKDTFIDTCIISLSVQGRAAGARLL